MFEQMGSAYAVAQAYRKSQQTVWRYINISILPEHLQKAVWAGKITMGDIQEIEPVFTEARSEIGDITSYRKYSESASYQKIVARCERIYTKQIQNKEELRKEYVDPYLVMLDKARVQKAKEEVEKAVPSDHIEAKVTLETPEEFEKAAKALRREAERRKTEEQKAEEKRQKSIAQARKSLNSVLKKIDGASKIIDVSSFRNQFIELEGSLEQNPSEVKEQLVTLGKEVDEAREQRQREIEEEKRRKEEEERKRRLEEDAKRKAEKELKERLEAEKKRIEKEAREKAKEELLRDPSLILHAKAIEARAKRLKDREAERAKGLELGEKARDALDSRLILIKASVEEMVTTIEESSVDVIITDPPYSKEYLDCFSSLTRFAFKALKPGKPLLVMVGQSYLPEVFRLLCEQMSYHWTLAYLTPGGQSPQIWPRKINTFWKPVIWLTKGKYEDKEWHGDVFSSDVNDNDKRFHHWGQSESGISRLVEVFTKPDDVVCDPFLGGGTTAVVAIRLGRRFIGSDIEENALETCRRRVVQSYE